MTVYEWEQLRERHLEIARMVQSLEVRLGNRMEALLRSVTELRQEVAEYREAIREKLAQVSAIHEGEA